MSGRCCSTTSSTGGRACWCEPGPPRHLHQPVGTLRRGRRTPAGRLPPAGTGAFPCAGRLQLPGLVAQPRGVLRRPQPEPQALHPGGPCHPSAALRPRPHRVPGAVGLCALAPVVAARRAGVLVRRGRVADRGGHLRVDRPPPPETPTVRMVDRRHAGAAPRRRHQLGPGGNRLPGRGCGLVRRTPTRAQWRLGSAGHVVQALPGDGGADGRGRPRGPVVAVVGRGPGPGRRERAGWVRRGPRTVAREAVGTVADPLCRGERGDHGAVPGGGPVQHPVVLPLQQRAAGKGLPLGDAGQDRRHHRGGQSHHQRRLAAGGGGGRGLRGMDGLADRRCRPGPGGGPGHRDDHHRLDGGQQDLESAVCAVGVRRRGHRRHARPIRGVTGHPLGVRLLVRVRPAPTRPAQLLLVGRIRLDDRPHRHLRPDGCLVRPAAAADGPRPGGRPGSRSGGSQPVMTAAGREPTVIGPHGATGGRTDALHRLAGWVRTHPGLVVLLVAPLVVLTVPLFCGRVFLDGDNFLQNFPLRVLVGRYLQHGALSLWNPYLFSGTPLLGGFNAGAAYPTNWLMAVLPPVTAWTINLALVYDVAVGGMYVFLRRQPVDSTAATFGAATFAFAGYMTAQIVHIDIVQGAAWLPWMLVAVHELTGGGAGRVDETVDPLASEPADPVDRHQHAAVD